jgi:hypothetical protein
MIRLFTILYKIDFKHVPSGIELFHSISPQFKHESAKCPPPCGTRGQMVRHGKYSRGLIDYDKGVCDHIVEVGRVKCRSCKSTHAALPDVLVPYKSYSIIFILRALKEYFHTRAATGISKKYGIAVSTLYAWRNRYLAHARLDLGAAVEEALLASSRWLLSASDICRTCAPGDYFKRFAFSFMQYCANAETAIFSSA